MRVSRWGGSLAVRLPRELVSRMQPVEGDEVALTVVDRITISVAEVEVLGNALAQLRTLPRPSPPTFRSDRSEANKC